MSNEPKRETSYLTEDPIDPQQLIDSVRRDSDGAICFFAGVVRDHHEGKRVTAIDYQAYATMAEKEISRVVRRVELEHPGVVVAVVHRLGFLRVGETSIAIATASPHRADAYEANRELIDRIKETVPIWKKEFGPEGESWVGWQGGSETEPGSEQPDDRPGTRD